MIDEVKNLHVKDRVLGNIRGVGPRKAASLALLGIHTVEDLMLHYPFRFDEFSAKSIHFLMDKEKVRLKGKVINQPTVQFYGHKKNRLSFQLAMEEGAVQVVFFNQPYLKEKILVGRELVVDGRWNSKWKTLTGMKILKLSSSKEEFAPVYRVNQQVHQAEMVKFIKYAFSCGYGKFLEENLPCDLRDRYRLISRQEAVYFMHFPRTDEEYRQALRRLKFEEFFYFQLQVQGLKRKEKKESIDSVITYSKERVENFTASLPFELTHAQKRVSEEILADMRSKNVMSRLLQGDVGSGKTVIAALAIVAAISAGKQSAFMVPTEILAVQHFENLHFWFQSFSMNVVLLTGSTSTKKRKEILHLLKNGEIDVVIGTHALIQEDVKFSDLGLAILDEQHRFGVNQRKLLREKGKNLNILLMSATPIPRTLALTLYGKMDVSVIDEKPSGRMRVETRWVRHSQFSAVLDLLEIEVSIGHQAYVISPLIEESETLDLKNVTALTEELAKHFGGQVKVALLHGKMKNDEKEALMLNFQQKEYDILVSTTVIEVGVDVPNATMMVVMDADHFGLSQLHQLRGRVGRGSQKSYAFLVANPKSEHGRKRMQILTQTDDGFLLAEKDLEMRGAGELLGTKQSGIPEFSVGDVACDFRILEVARDEAVKVWKVSNWWDKKEFLELSKGYQKKQTEEMGNI
ncbi:MAG: ATP-dependent DNA helicase RecG [Lactobacillales bacterium]|jgi:ATP-dependent DNA helicase RecG|nr:ATP-dependent DNA helicase RecG [Lactobacillales bacterium]